jgi:hypothetical protein
VTAVQGALEAYFAPLQHGGGLLRRFVRILPNRVIMCLHRLEYSNRQWCEACRLMPFEPTVDVTAFTTSKSCAAWYGLTWLTSYIWSHAQGQYVAFSSLDDEWWLFNDAIVRIVHASAGFQDNTPVQNPTQTAHRDVSERLNRFTSYNNELPYIDCVEHYSHSVGYCSIKYRSEWKDI